MKRQNGVVLSGKLADLRAAEVKAGDLAGVYTVATLITDHAAYGGHHCVLFPEEHAPDALAYWGLTDGNLEVTIEGWLRSTPAGVSRWTGPATSTTRAPDAAAAAASANPMRPLLRLPRKRTGSMSS